MLSHSSPLNVSTNESVIQDCLFSTTGLTITISFIIITSVTLLPLYIFVLYLWLQQWLQQPSAKSMSHSDVFTFNMIIVELLSFLGIVIAYVGQHSSSQQMIDVGFTIFSLNFFGQLFFHLLTCLERYLAVVHPITYLSLRKEKAIRIRNIIIFCVWLACFAIVGSIGLIDQNSREIVSCCLVLPVLVTMSLCNLMVLLVLIRPRPGDRHRQKVDQSKMRAFYIILLIMAVLLLRFGWNVYSLRIMGLLKLHMEQKCVFILSTLWTSIPSSLVLPLLFLHRGRKLC